MAIKYTEEQLNSVDKSMLIQMFLNQQEQLEKVSADSFLIIKQIQAVYREEGKLKELSSKERLVQRQVVVKPLVDALFVYLKQHENEVGTEKLRETSVYKGYKRDKIEMRVDRVEVSDFPLYLNTVAGGLDRRDQTIGGFSFVVKIYAVPVVEIIGQLLYLLGRYGFNTQFGDCL